MGLAMNRTRTQDNPEEKAQPRGNADLGLECFSDGKHIEVRHGAQAPCHPPAGADRLAGVFDCQPAFRPTGDRPSDLGADRPQPGGAAMMEHDDTDFEAIEIRKAPIGWIVVRKWDDIGNCIERGTTLYGTYPDESMALSIAMATAKITGLPYRELQLPGRRFVVPGAT